MGSYYLDVGNTTITILISIVSWQLVLTILSSLRNTHEIFSTTTQAESGWCYHGYKNEHTVEESSRDLSGVSWFTLILNSVVVISTIIVMVVITRKNSYFR